MPQRETISFSPFKPEYLGTDWKVTFGEWVVEDGSIRHLRPDDPGGDDPVIAGGGMAGIHCTGNLVYSFSNGGYDPLYCCSHLSRLLASFSPLGISLSLNKLHFRNMADWSFLPSPSIIFSDYSAYGPV